MRVAIASDHAGFNCKQDLVKYLGELGHTVIDLGTNSEAPVDYPDYVSALSNAILGGAAERGIMICGSGVGASVAANKIKGIRAAICHDTYSAHQGVEHDDLNVLVLGGRVIGSALARELTATFVHATFSHEERHVRRLKKVEALEERSNTASGGNR